MSRKIMTIHHARALLLAGIAATATLFAVPDIAQAQSTRSIFEAEPSPTPTRDQLLEQRRVQLTNDARERGKCAGHVQGGQIMLVTQYDTQDPSVRESLEQLANNYRTSVEQMGDAATAAARIDSELYKDVIQAYYGSKNAAITEILILSANDATFGEAQQILANSQERCPYVPPNEQ